MEGSTPIQTREGNDTESILAEAIERARIGEEAWQTNYDLARDDIAFLSGQQWPDLEMQNRALEGRPALVLNQLPKFIDQIIGDQRQNKPSIKVSPTDEMAATKIKSKTGKEHSLAEVYEGLIRNIEYNCDAEASYDIAFQHAVESGFGWLRVLTDYSADDVFDQDIKIKAVKDRFSVLIDPRIQEFDGSDMEWAFITEVMSKKEFEKRYPDASSSEVVSSGSNFWMKDDSVRVAEYFRREPVTRTLILLTDGRTVWKDEAKDILDELEDSGVRIQRERKVKTHKVIWMKITSQDVLEGPTTWEGSTIPVIPVFGKDIILNGQPIYRGLIRHSKDAQRMHNYWMTTVTEKIALAPKAPWVGPAQAFAGYEKFWNDANRTNLAYLPFNDKASQAPQRTMNVPMPTAEIQMAMQGIDEIKNTIGMFDASLGNSSNETSGRAILARQKEGDTGTFAFVDNLTRSIRRCGKILIELIPKIYDSERVIRMRFDSGEGDSVLINQTILDSQTMKMVSLHDISMGKYDVVIRTGPSYNTQRLEAADSLMEFIKAVPQAGQVAADLVATNMDWPGADELAKRLKKVLPQGMLDPEEAEKAGIVPPPPPPVDPLQQQAMAIQQATLEADMAKSEAIKVKANADVELAKMKLQEQSMSQGVNDQAMQAHVKQLVAQAIAEYQTQVGQQN